MADDPAATGPGRRRSRASWSCARRACPTELRVDGDDVWWSRGPPRGGWPHRRAAPRAGRPIDDVLAGRAQRPHRGARVRRRRLVGARHGVLWFADWATSGCTGVEPGEEPVALTPEPEVPVGLRYADGDVQPRRHDRCSCVREQHHADGARGHQHHRAARRPRAERRRRWCVAGPDFVSDPRWSPDGDACCWLEWDHPDMPWDATRLVVEPTGATRTVVAGGDRGESIGQPRWAPDGVALVLRDRTGWWNLYRWTPDGAVETVVDLGARDRRAAVGVRAVRLRVPRRRPRRGRVPRRRARAARGARAGRRSRHAPLDVPFTSIDGAARARSARWCYIARRSPTHGARTSSRSTSTRRRRSTCSAAARPRARRRAGSPRPSPSRSRPAAARTAHALLYPPTNPDRRARRASGHRCS